MKHQLKADGAAFSNTTLTRVDPNSTKGTGVALCSCGTPSTSLPTRAARKAWFAEHKAKHEAATAEQGMTAEEANAEVAAAVDEANKRREAEGYDPLPTGDDEKASEDKASEEPADEDPIEDKPAAKAGSQSFDVAAMKRKISALLRKAEVTTNEHERDAFNAKAERLMLRLGLNQAELEAAGDAKQEDIVQEMLRWENVYAKNLVTFGHTICGGLGDLQTLESGRWSSAALYIIGFETDVKAAVQLIKSLEQQAFSAMKRWQRENREERRLQTNYDRLVGNRSFLAGFAREVANRLRDERKQVHEEATPGAALVLASKQDKVNDALSEMYPKLGKATRRGHGAYSSAAAAAGRAAGTQADIGHTRVGGRKGELS